MALTEKQYFELSKYAVNVAQKYVQNVDNANDIAQNALLALISSKSEITNPQAWIHTTVRREASLFLKKELKEIEIVQEKKVNTIKPSKSEVENDDVFTSDPYKLFRLLKKEDYDEYKKFKKYGFSLPKFVEKEKVSYDVAHQRKYKLKRNLLAALSLEDGWSFSPQILNYAQYTSIMRFVKQLKSNLTGEKKTDMKIYLTSNAKENFDLIFADVIDCLEWAIKYNKTSYELTLVCSTKSGPPCFNKLTIEFNAANYLRIVTASQREVEMVIPNKLEVLQKYKKKGMIDLPREQTLAILSNKQTTR